MPPSYPCFTLQIEFMAVTAEHMFQVNLFFSSDAVTALPVCRAAALVMMSLRFVADAVVYPHAEL